MGTQWAEPRTKELNLHGSLATATTTPIRLIISRDYRDYLFRWLNNSYTRFADCFKTAFLIFNVIPRVSYVSLWLNANGCFHCAWNPDLRQWQYLHVTCAHFYLFPIAVFMLELFLFDVFAMAGRKPLILSDLTSLYFQPTQNMHIVLNFIKKLFLCGASTIFSKLFFLSKNLFFNVLFVGLFILWLV